MIRNSLLILGFACVMAGPTTAAAPQLPGQIGGAVKRVNQFRDLQMTDKEEMQLGEAVNALLRERYGVVQNEALHRYVALVGSALAQSSTRPALSWTFTVLDTDGVNAFAAPGGFVHVTRGALGLMQNEAELANVLGHEIIHITAKHTIRSMQKSKAVQMGAEETMSGNAALFQRVVTATYNDIVEKGFGREDENESDEKAAALANQLGYSPHGLGSFLARLKERNKDSKEKRGLFASHPAMQERLDRLTKQIASSKLNSTLLLPERYKKFVTFTSKPITEIATVEPGAAGLSGGGEAKTEPKKEEPKAEEPKKKGGFGLGKMMPGGGGEKKQAQATGSGAARGVDPEKDSRGGTNPKPVVVKIAAADVAAFKKEGGLK